MDITLKDVTLTYGKKGPEALRGISTVIRPGTHLLLGENGAGKTTLLHIIAGLRFPTSGSCDIDGLEPRHRRPSLMRHIALMENGMEFPQKTFARMSATHGCLYPGFTAEQLSQNIAAFGLDADADLSALSLGNRHKALIAYMAALNTDILLLDEAANGLDIESKETLQRLIAAAGDPQRTIIVSTHNYADLQNLFDSVMIMRQGRLVLNADIDSITQRLLFVADPDDNDVADALFVHRSGLHACAILPNDDNETSSIDFAALYTALHSDAADNILNALRQ